MATQAQKSAFIKEIAPYAQLAYKELGKVKPSICIAMACVESAYGTSPIMRKNNAFFGQKCGSGKTATKYWDKTFFTTKTKEEYVIGVHTIITDAFRSYRNMKQCVYNFYELLNTKLYSRVLATSDYKTQMQQIKMCGYMTSSTEVNTVLSIISQYNLTVYDGVSSTPTQSLFYPSCSSKYTSLVDALESVGENDVTFGHRKQIAQTNGIVAYSGTANQNTILLNLLKEGKLKK